MREEIIGGQRLICGDNLQAMPALAAASVDLVATDPPYGISFMGKAWDKALPDPQTWAECYRVLKPGGSAVVMSGARLDCLWRMCRDLEAAGFELEQTALFWCYRSGFPKGGDLSKMADARAGAERKVVGERKSPFRMADPKMGNSLMSTVTGDTRQVDDGGYIRRVETAPTTDLAKQLDGWFTKGKVKPAVEVIIWARKPIGEKTELGNMTKWGVGGVNCGECMVPFGDLSTGVWGTSNATCKPTFNASSTVHEYRSERNPDGRFPANLIVTDEALGLEDSRYFDIDRWAAEHGYSEDWAAAAEAGVLQIPKPSKAEKNAGCEGLELREPIHGAHDQATLQVTRSKLAHQNHHPTCKPVTLFAYLIEFLTRPGATVLDPFLGSGTTLVACAQTGRNGIGVELGEDYFSIACARTAHATVQAQLTLTEATA